MRKTHFRRLSVLTAMFSFAIAGPPDLHAAEGVFTLGDAVTVALERNGDLKALREEEGVGRAGRVRSGLLPNPTLELEAETGALTGSPSERTFSLGVSQEFLTGGKRGKRIALAESELKRYAGQLEEAKRRLLLDVKQGYFDLWLAQERVGLAQKSNELNRRLLETAGERFAAGDIPEIEVNWAKVELARSDAAKIAAERELAPVRLRLLSLIGAVASDPLQVAAVPEPAPFQGDAERLKALALDRRADLRALQAELEKGNAEVELAKAERLPNLTGGIALSVERSLTEVGGLEERDTEYLVALSLSAPIPLFDRNQAGVMEARARSSAAQTRYLAAKRNVEREVDAALSGLAASETLLRLYKEEVLPQMAENLDLVQEAYRLGEIGLLEVIDEQRKYTEARNDYLAALHQRQIAQAQLEAALGTELSHVEEGK